VTLREDVREVARGWRWGRRPLVPASAEPWTRRRTSREFPTEWARAPAGRATREAIQRYLLKPLVWSETNPSVEGLHHLAEVRPPVMFVANHSSHLDAPLVLCSLPKAWRERTATAAAADYFFDVWWRAVATALVFNAFPIERSGGERSGGGRSRDNAGRLVADGWNLLVFPEGTRSRDGWVGRYRHGAARLCLDNDLPAVPVTIRGAFAAMPRGRSWPRPGRMPISVRFGPALHVGEGEDYRTFSRRLQQAQARLWDEDASDWWESLRRQAQGATPSLGGPPGPRWRRVWEATRPLSAPGPPRVWRR
jgi:1-acyl-sn-glycerol-3-phosphate acyltransferase